ncbi:MAG: hypothetical protein ACM3JQ_05995, partial [Candidatus Eiseniibacteriota bacterium]
MKEILNYFTQYKNLVRKIICSPYPKTNIKTVYVTLFLTLCVTLYYITPSPSFAVTIGQVTKVNNTLVPSGLTSSVINSGPRPSTTNFQIMPGYKIEPVIWNLTLPDAVTFDGKGNTFVSESGYAFGGLQPNPRILKIDVNGTISILTDRFLNTPIGDMKFHDGKLYVSSKGKVSTVDPVTGFVTDI